MKYYLILGALFFAASCTTKTNIDLLIVNGTVYTVDNDFSVAEAVAIDKGKIVEVGTTADLGKKYSAAETIDAGGNAVLPGFIDAHAHFMGYGASLENVDLTGTESWEEAVERVKEFAKNSDAEWITGRGWDQNDWPVKKFPTNDLLNAAFPDRPVLLTRIDGHAAIGNRKAFELAGVQPGAKVDGGVVEMTNGKFTGILIDNAISLVGRAIPNRSLESTVKALENAERNCFAQGLTQIHECGISYKDALLIDSLQKAGQLKMKFHALLSDNPSNMEWLFTNGKVKTERLSVRGFKVFADGALGSRGACLLEPYSDQPGWRGFLLSPPSHFDSVAKAIYENGMQMCTHAIGDSGNRTMLTTYAKYLNGKNDLRWRIEHAQVINKDDFHYFGDNNIIPSVQPTHATSDMYWAVDRLGPERTQYAYAYKDLLQQNGWLALGTDFPVEDISPFKTFFAAVFRQDAKGYPDGGFEPQNALSREETIRGMTIWAAKAAFQEDEKGSIEKGKYADIIILDKDLMKTPKEEVLNTKVVKTIVNGEVVYGGK